MSWGKMENKMTNGIRCYTGHCFLMNRHSMLPGQHVCSALGKIMEQSMAGTMERTFTDLILPALFCTCHRWLLSRLTSLHMSRLIYSMTFQTLRLTRPHTSQCGLSRQSRGHGQTKSSAGCRAWHSWAKWLMIRPQRSEQSQSFVQ